MACPFAVLGFENPDKSLGFALTAKPIQYIERSGSGVYTSRSIGREARLRWAVPAHSHAKAIALRDRWNSGSPAQTASEVSRFSVPQSIVHDLYEIWFDGGGLTGDDEALELIGEHGRYAVLDSERGSDELVDDDVPTPPGTGSAGAVPRKAPGRQPEHRASLGIKLAIFDLDMTLVDSSMLKAARDKQDWDEALRRIPEVKPLICRGECVIHELPRRLAERGVKVALVSRANRYYVNSVVSAFDIHCDWIQAPSGENKSSAFERAMDEFGAEPWNTVAFGDDLSDFYAAAANGILSLGNPWASRIPATCSPDISWPDAGLLLEQGDWGKRLRYIGETEGDAVQWHAGSVIRSEDDVCALGRYFPAIRHRNRHQDRLSRSIISGKSSQSGVPQILGAFQTTVEHLGQRDKIDVVFSVPPHPGKPDRFLPYRRIVAEQTGAEHGIAVTERRDVPNHYRQLSREAKRDLRAGRFEIDTSLDGRTVLLIDDVVTTGSTIGALKDAAEEAGAARVIQLAFALTQD